MRPGPSYAVELAGFGPEPAVSAGSVYVMGQAGSRLLKIGMTRRDAKSRARDHTILAVPMVVEFELQCEHPQRLEVLVHRRLSHCRVRGELFDIDLPTAIEAILQTAVSHDLIPG